jgi:hypothetical protein
MLADKGWANTYLAGDAFAAQLDADIAATDDRAARHRSGQVSEGTFPRNAAPAGRRSSSRRDLPALPR